MKKDNLVSTASSYFNFASDLSSRFVSIAPEKVHAEIQQVLPRITAFFAVDCCAIYKSPGDEDDVELLQAFDARPMASAFSNLDVKAQFPKIFRDVLRNKQVVCLPAPDDLPAAKENESSSPGTLRHCIARATTDFDLHIQRLYFHAGICARQAGMVQSACAADASSGRYPGECHVPKRRAECASTHYARSVRSATNLPTGQLGVGCRKWQDR